VLGLEGYVEQLVAVVSKEGEQLPRRAQALEQAFPCLV
jgi:hypothetical protein